MTEQISVNEASQTLRHAMRETVKRHRWWYHIQGVLMVFAGIVAILYPLFTTVAAAAFLGWMLIFTGIFQGISLIGAQNVPHFWLQLLSLVLAVIVGFLFIRNPGAGVGTLTLLLIVYFMVEGMSKIVFSLTIRPFPNWGWVLASGVIGVLLAFYLISSPA
ncbi:MAG: HdeD family acid-resistance protein, partial [Nitrospirota bacterium]|nr:HdeD family acid-resistance protein [Nitrospirota bacterium]